MKERANVYTPFLRRFTDHHAYDLNETIALYSEVKQAHFASIWSKPDIAERVLTDCVETISELTDLKPYAPLNAALDKALTGLIELETTIIGFPDVDFSCLSMREQVDLNRFLRSKKHFLENDDRIYGLLKTTLCNLFGGIIQAFPNVEDQEQGFSIPLVSMLGDPADIVDRVIGTLVNDELMDAGLFVSTINTLYENVCRVSGISPDKERTQPLIAAPDSDLPPEKLVRAYLGRTPFEPLFSIEVPFVIPEHVRFEHTHIIGGAGWGKSTLIAQTVLADLEKENPPATIIIDPHGTLIEEIERLAVFNGRLNDRLIIVDPRDNPPPALNMFDSSKRMQGYSEHVREEIENNTLSLYQYMFGSIASALTAKQSTAFAFVLRLMFSIKGATIGTLLELMEEKTGKGGIELSTFKADIEKLPAIDRNFFQNHFYNQSEFGETRQQITHRLYSLLQYREFDRMFSVKDRKLDMFDCIQTGKIVLIHAARARMGKEASQLFGRYMIALAFGAAFERSALPQSQWHPAFLIVDEAADFFDEQIETMLDTVRKYKLGLTFAHQRIEGQLSEAMRSALSANTSIKFAGGVAARDAGFMAKDMHCDAEFIMAQKKKKDATSFAGYVRGFTDHAVSLTVPLGILSKQPKMTDEAHAAMRHRNRDALRSSAPVAPKIEPQQQETPTPPPASSPPPASDTEAASEG